jgi:hypothetical protein
MNFTSTDIGSPLLTGTSKRAGADIEITAGGRDIWETRDEFHFAHVGVTGDFTLSACLASLTMGDVYTKAGLMLRASLEAGAEHAFLLAFGDNQPRNRNNGGLEFQYRAQAGGPCTGVYPPQPLPAQPDFPVHFPRVWLRLCRRGNTITAENGQDGRTWRTFTMHQQAFPVPAYLGLAVTSHNVNQHVRAVFRQVELG